MTGNVLAQICADKADHVAAQKQRRPLSSLEAAIADTDSTGAAKAPRGFIKALATKKNADKPGLIAEIKKASPSKGLIRSDFDPPSLARSYAAAGATCLSVLTDGPYFQGSDAYIADVRNVVGLPILRKDFMIDPYQIVESRALGADCILVIMAAVDDALARDLIAESHRWGMDALVEVHDSSERDRAVALGATMIGINNRDLRTLSVDLATTEALAPGLPSGTLAVCESGLYTEADLLRMRAIGISTFLVGESLMRQDDVESATRRLLGEWGHRLIDAGEYSHG